MNADDTVPDPLNRPEFRSRKGDGPAYEKTSGLQAFFLVIRVIRGLSNWIITV